MLCFIHRLYFLCIFLNSGKKQLIDKSQLIHFASVKRADRENAFRTAGRVTQCFCFLNGKNDATVSVMTSHTWHKAGAIYTPTIVNHCLWQCSFPACNFTFLPLKEAKICFLSAAMPEVHRAYLFSVFLPLLNDDECNAYFSSYSSQAIWSCTSLYTVMSLLTVFYIKTNS